MDEPAVKAFKRYYSKLVKVLPMNDMSSDLYSHDLLPGDRKAKIEALGTQNEKAEYFLDYVIKPGMDIGFTGQFDELLRVMENSDNPPVKFLAGEIKKSMSSGSSSSEEKASLLLNVSQGHFGVLPATVTDQSCAVAKFSKSLSINAAYSKLTTRIEDILETRNFRQLRRACIREIHAFGSTIPKSLVHKIQPTKSLDDMLDVLAQSPYWNWFDTRLLQALVMASGSAEAEEWLESFKATYYSEKIIKFIPYVSIKPFQESTNLVEKFDKDPKELTVSELLKHKFKLEHEVLDINEGELVLRCVKTGCVELTWQVPLEMVYRAYTSMKKKHDDELSSLAIRSLVCEEADSCADIPILWQGQEVGEIGPIESLPEHVRQDPYPLPQGFQLAMLSDTDEVVDFMNANNPSAFVNSTMVDYYTKHPAARCEWQFGIKANGKLISTILAYPFCMRIRGVTVTFLMSKINCDIKCNYIQLRCILYKELMRRASLNKVNQMIVSLQDRLFRPVVMLTSWENYLFEAPKHLQSSSSRIPGWKKMTVAHIQSSLTLVNEYSSQFEVGQFFTSEEEFSYHFLCPAVPNLVSTYVVESKGTVTDLVSFKLFHYVMLPSHVHITTVVSLKTPVKSLLTNAIAHAKSSGALTFSILQSNIESEILESLSFKQSEPKKRCFYNYRYQEIPQANYWCTID